MEIRHISPEDRGKAMAVIVLFGFALIATVWYGRSQRWVLINELAAVLFVAIVFAIIYDFLVIR